MHKTALNTTPLSAAEVPTIKTTTIIRTTSITATNNINKRRATTNSNNNNRENLKKKIYSEHARQVGALFEKSNNNNK